MFVSTLGLIVLKCILKPCANPNEEPFFKFGAISLL